MVVPTHNALDIFPSYIWKFKYDFDLSVIYPKIQQIFSLVDNNSLLEDGDALSTAWLDQSLQPHTWIELAHFQETLGIELETIKDQYKFIDRQSRVLNSWCNRHGRGGYTKEHNHNFSTFVASCYLKCPPGSGNIEFRNPLEYHLNNFPMAADDNLFVEVPVEQNDVLIFPGWLKHRVQPSRTDEERIVLTINIK